MRVTLPNLNLQRVTARADGWMWESDFDDSHRVIDVIVPSHIDERDVEVFSKPLDILGNVDPTRATAVIKAKVRSNRRG